MDKDSGKDMYRMDLAASMNSPVKINGLRYSLAWLTRIDILNSSFTFPGLNVRYPSKDCCYHLSPSHVESLAHRTEGLFSPLKVDVS